MRLGVAPKWIEAAFLSGVAIACGSSGSNQTSPQPDSGSPTVGSAVHNVTPDGYKVCARLDDAADCFACCASFFPLAQQKVLNAAAQCTCVPGYCGPLGNGSVAVDSGGDDGSDSADDAEPDGAAFFEGGNEDEASAAEAGNPLPIQSDAATGFPFGVGSCSAAMCALQTAPSQLCVKCTLGVLTGSEGLPQCPASTAACNADPDCAPVLACGAYCPSAVPD